MVIGVAAVACYDIDPEKPDRTAALPTIDPTATVDRRATLADDVEIGPGCHVEGCVTIGAGTRLAARVVLKGPLVLGRNNILYPNVCLGLEPQDRKFDPSKDGSGVVIGDDNIFREGVTIHRATGERPTTVGHRNYLMVNSHLGHDTLVGDDCTLANGAMVGGHGQIGDRVTLGGTAGIHQFCRVGRLGMVSGVIAITQDLPPFCVAYSMRSVSSLNIVGLRRAGYRKHIAPLKKAFDIFFRRQLGNRSALKRIEAELGDDPLCMEFARFIAESKRGICRYRNSDGDAAEVF